MTAPVPEVVELRVHGVAGTPAAELLDRPLVRQVAGDATAGFYRPLLDSELLDEPVPPAAPSCRAYLEGYAWGGLTSGAPARALWLLLLPFALLNVAPRLRHGPATTGRTRLRILLALHRWAALGATAALAVAASGVGIDLVGWQCGRGAPCTALPGWFAGFLTALPPGLRLAAGAVAPAALLVVLWLASRRTAQRYEHVPDGRRLGPVPGGPGPARSADDADPPLSSEWLWRGAYMVARLRHLHLLGGWACVLIVLDAAVEPLVLRVPAMGLAVLALAGIGVALATGSVVGRAEHPTARGRAVLWAVWILSAAATVTTAAALGSGSVAVPAAGLPGYDTIIALGVGVQMLLVVALAATSGSPGPWLERWRGPAMAALGTLLGAVFSAGVYTYAATWLTTGHPVPGLGDVARSLDLTVPGGIQLAAVSFAWTVAVLAVALAVLGLAAWAGHRARGRNTAIDAALRSDYPPSWDDDRDQQIRSIFWFARLVDRAGSPVTVLIAVLTLVGAAVAGYGVVRAMDAGAAPPSAGWPGSYRFGAYAAAGVLVLLVGLGAAVFRASSTRRSVGILWDLAAFWPRSVHPLAPPCYAERTVPDLKERIRWHTAGAGSDYPTGALVLAAHSQGTVIAAAALLQMAASPKDRGLLPRVAFLSYGCVLRRLYSTYFPVYFDEDTLGMLDAGRWTNLWRHSDYLGGRVGVAGVDRELVDPLYARAGGDLGYPLPGRHSMYPRDPAFQEAVAGLARRLPPARPGVPGAAPRTTM